MKKISKIAALLISILLIVSLCACKSGSDTVSSSIPSTDNSSNIISSTQDTVIENESTVSSEEITSSEEDVSTTASTSTEESKDESKEETTPEEEPKEQPENVPAVAPATPSTITISPEFEVYDPENTRGLSEKSMGYGHGQKTATDNQTRFDSMNGVDALAIDKITGKNCVYLTFDCGYEYNNLTLSILDTLKEKNVKAAFFCTLSYIKNNPEKVKRMIDEGHIVGNHSSTHPVFPDITRTEMAEEVYGVHKYLEENYGYTPKYFRFPTGAYSESSLELVTSIGYKSVFWSFAYKDWETANQPATDTAFETIKTGFYPGSVLLLHAVSQTNTTLLAQIIDYGTAQGYTFATLDDYSLSK